MSQSGVDWIPGVHTLEDCADRCLQHSLEGHEKPCQAFVFGWGAKCYFKDADDPNILQNASFYTSGPISTCWHSKPQLPIPTESCQTVNGENCTFPFIYGDVAYYGCVRPYQEAWCSTQYLYSDDNWDYCSAECPITIY